MVSIISGWSHNRKGEEVRLYVHIYTHISMISRVDILCVLIKDQSIDTINRSTYKQFHKFEGKL